MQSFVHPLIRWKHELGRKKKSATSAHKFLYSYLILWISLRKSASLGHRSPTEIQRETLTRAENVQRGPPAHVCLHARAACTLLDGHTRFRGLPDTQPNDNSGVCCHIMSNSLCTKKNLEDGNKRAGMHTELEMMVGAAEVMQEPLAL